MRGPPSIQSRAALAIGLLVTLLWLVAAGLTARVLRDEMNEVFDSALEETAQRILPLAVSDVLGRETEGVAQRVAPIRSHEEYFTYVVRDAAGRILLQSHQADPADFPPYAGPGFSQTATHRIYSDAALQGSIIISVAEPLNHRAEVAQEAQTSLALPLLIVIPLGLVGIVWLVRQSFRPLRRFTLGLSRRGARDLSAVDVADLPAEIRPMGETLNGVLHRLHAAFEAERSFAANAAHELRTPLAGAIAQAQRLRQETADPVAADRAAQIEATLKRLTRLSERLMQLARAEGGRLRLDAASDLRPILRLLVDDAQRNGAQLELTLPETAVMSDLDPDVFGILFRNLVENAVRHGTPGQPILICLNAKGQFCVTNDCDPIPPDLLARLETRFARAPGAGEGSGIGLAIVRTIATRAKADLTLQSPIPGQARGFAACFGLSPPTTAAPLPRNRRSTPVDL